MPRPVAFAVMSHGVCGLQLSQGLCSCTSWRQLATGWAVDDTGSVCGSRMVMQAMETHRVQLQHTLSRPWLAWLRAELGCVLTSFSFPNAACFAHCGMCVHLICFTECFAHRGIPQQICRSVPQSLLGTATELSLPVCQCWVECSPSADHKGPVPMYMGLTPPLGSLCELLVCQLCWCLVLCSDNRRVAVLTSVFGWLV